MVCIRKRNLYLILLFIALTVALIFLLNPGRLSCFNATNLQVLGAGAPAGISPFGKGERIVYNVQLFGIKIGQAQLQFMGKTRLDNKEVELIILSTNVKNLKDTEKVYVDSDTFLPLRVERSIVLWGKKMNIVEEYDVKNNSVTVNKTESGKTSRQIIKSSSPLQNIISLIFLFRKNADFETGQAFKVKLPLTEFKMKMTKVAVFNALNNKYKACLFESEPAKYRIWIDRGTKRIPLRVDGAVGFGNTAMVVREFIPGEN